MDYCRRCMSCMSDMGSFDVCMNCGWIEGTVPDEAFKLYPRTILSGRYEIGTSISYEGASITYVAWDRAESKKVAVKEYYPIGLVSRISPVTAVCVNAGREDAYSKGLDRFVRETESLMNLRGCPFVVETYDCFKENSTAYAVMEYLDGMSLTDYLDRCGGKLSPGEALGIALPVLDALHAVHGSGIVHRDVCPDNIFVLKDGGVRLIDFGSALLSMKGSDDSRTRISNPGYDSPELQTVGEKADIRTDIYSTGAVLYRMLTGFPPEDASDRLVQDTAVPPGNIVQVPENIDKAVMRSISPDKNLRFSSAEEFKEALIGAKKVRSADEESVRRRKNKVLITAVSSVLALILLGAGAVYGLLWKFVAPTTLNIVLPEYDDNLKNESLRVLFDPDGAEDESIAAEFLRQYPQVILSVEWVPEEQYADRLTLMISEGSTPDLFYAPEVNDLITSAAADTSAVLSEISDDDSMSTEAIAAIQNLFPTGRYLPTGINPAVIYVNSNVVRGDSLNLPGSGSLNLPGSGSGINEFAGVCDADGESMLLIPEGNLYAVLIGTDGWSGDLSPGVIIPDGYEALICSDEDAFAALADGSAAFVLGSYSDYRLVQNALPGFYAVESVQNMPAGFSGLFCIGSDGGRAAEKFALLLYSHTAQSALNIGAFCTLPLREDTSELFASIYPEFNEIGGTDISSMTPVGETFYSFDDYFTDIPA